MEDVASVPVRVFTMGSVCCVVCGHWIPQETRQPLQRGVLCAVCAHCGTTQPETRDGAVSQPPFASQCTSAAVLFTANEIHHALEAMKLRAAKVKGVPMAGTTEVDNRVVEDAFCEACGVHRPCKVFARQTRSADEGQTIFYQCTKCRAEWQLNS